jgi:hypothetical protein
VPIGPSGETLCSCAVELSRACGLSANFIATLEAMGGSGMGIYEHLGWQDGVLGLRDILDGRAHRCIVPSGHRGAKGELWYVRLLPPLDERFDHGVCFTSPYVLRGTRAVQRCAVAVGESLAPQVGAERRRRADGRIPGSANL